MTMTIPNNARAFSARDKRRYIKLVAKGTPGPAAAERVGFAYSTVKRHLKVDAEFAEAVQLAGEELDETIEGHLVGLALKDNLGAIQYWLNNRKPERWRDAKTVKTELSGPGGGPIQLVQANVIALREVLSDPGTRAAALGMVRSIDVASRAALPSGEDGDPFAFSRRLSDEHRAADERPKTPPLPQ